MPVRASFSNEIDPVARGGLLSERQGVGVGSSGRLGRTSGTHPPAVAADRPGVAGRRDSSGGPERAAACDESGASSPDHPPFDLGSGRVTR